MGDSFMGGGGPPGGMLHRAPLRPGLAGGGLPPPLGPGALGGRAGAPMGPPGGPPPGGRHVMLGPPGPGGRRAPEDGGGPRAGPHSAGFSLALGMDTEPAPGGCARAPCPARRAALGAVRSCAPRAAPLARRRWALRASARWPAGSAAC